MPADDNRLARALTQVRIGGEDEERRRRRSGNMSRSKSQERRLVRDGDRGESRKRGMFLIIITG